MEPILYIAVLIGVFALFFYLLMPLVVYSNAELHIASGVHEMQLFEAEASDRAYMERVSLAMQPIGFLPVGYINTRGMNKDALMVMRLFVNPKTHTLAIANSVHVLNASADGEVKRYVEFSADFDDGTQFNTSRMIDGATADNGSSKKTLILKNLDNPAELYRYHEFWMAEQALNGTRTPIRMDQTPQAILIHEMERELRRKTGRGLWREPSPSVFKLSLRGAYLMTWAQLPPVKQIREARVYGTGQSLMQRADRRA
ncbi:MAG: hypothetical protein KTR15_03155 [Phycisphaeraceae bacterium]|nr:hypothetical protein [Phycisphaeraceae bacterium]